MSRTVAILDLKPTQFAVGMLEVESKFEHIHDLSKKSLKKFLTHNPIEVVVAPNKELYIVDGHHHVAACFQAGVRKIRASVLHTFTRISYEKFWNEMRRRHWCHLFDQFGEGPRHPMYLPPDVRGLGDDPYRSLAWLVRKEGGFRQTSEAFVEFVWANYFRRKQAFTSSFDLDYKIALTTALRLARAQAAYRDTYGWCEATKKGEQMAEVKSDVTPHRQYRQSLGEQVNTVQQEARMVLPGIQALFGFQLIAVFNHDFSLLLSNFDRQLHLMALLLVAISAVLVMAPAAYHRQANHQISTHFVELSSRLLAWSMVPLAIGTCVDIYLVCRVITSTVFWSVIITGAFGIFYFWTWFLFPRLRARKMAQLPTHPLPESAK